MSPLPPHRMNDLRSLAKALAGERETARPVRRRRWSPRAVYLGTALAAALATLGVRALFTCRGPNCAPAPSTASRPPTVAVALAPPIAEEPSSDTVPTARATEGDDPRLVTTEIGSLLAAAREEADAPAAEPTKPADDPRAVTVERTPSRTRRERPALALREPEPIARTPPPPVPPDEPAVEEPAAPTATTDLSGRWLVTNAIDDASVPEFRGLRIRFRVQLEQHGDRITGRGEKFTVDDRPVPRGQRSPIELEGVVHGRDVTLRFVERGTRRVSRGDFRWRISPDGDRLDGSFGSDAASAAGRSHADRDG